MAGASVAAALGELGYAVLVAEPGLDGGKRLAGELIHPPGASDLSQLGLLPSLERAGGVPIRGFAVWPDSIEPRSDAPETHRAPGGTGAACVLPYAEVSGLADHGLAVEHRGDDRRAPPGRRRAASRQRVDRRARHRPRSRRCPRGRRDAVARWAGRARPVAAPGGGGRRKLARPRDGGYRREEKKRLSTMAGYIIDSEALSPPGLRPRVRRWAGTGAGVQDSPPTEARVMLDIPRRRAWHRRSPRRTRRTSRPFRPPFVKRCARCSPLNVRPRVRKLHPSAEHAGPGARGLGRRRCGVLPSPRRQRPLRRAPATRSGSERALEPGPRRHLGGAEALRRPATRSRSAPASRSLAARCTRPSRITRQRCALLRRGLFRYWARSDSGRSASMGLLSHARNPHARHGARVRPRGGLRAAPSS